MASTNKTANYELSQFLGSDSPKWLTDYNSDMEKIDVAIAGVKTQADATDLVVSGHTSAISSLDSTVSDQTTAIQSIRSDVTANTGSINTINSLIGNGEPTTSDKTLIGAINELYGDIHGSGPSPIEVDAEDVGYDNTTSGLTATTVQAAIDELATGSPAAATEEKQTATLAAGSTSVTLTFTEVTIAATSFVSWFTSDPEVNPTAITSTSTTVTLTFEAQASALTVGAKVEN